MNATKYKRILFGISLMIVLTLLVQGYWGYRTFNAEKQELVADVQNSLNAAVDTYFTELAQRSTFNFLQDSLKLNMDSSGFVLRKNLLLDSLPIDGIKHINIQDSSHVQSLKIITDDPNFEMPWNAKAGDSIFDSILGLDKKPFEILTSKIVVSISENDLELPLLDSILNKELLRQNLRIKYSLHYAAPTGENQIHGEHKSQANSQMVTAVSSFISPNSSLNLLFKNTTPIILYRNAISLGLSVLFVGCIIFFLLYLLRIIQQQKQLAEIKNDLISNITHEFKTPLATIGVALEGMEHFNTSNDPEKTKKYANMSMQQVNKLSHMVDKLLETATLDSNKLELKKEAIDLVPLLKKLAAVPEAFISYGKEIQFKTSLSTCFIPADPFHLENVIHTLIDNAFKYGGNKITVGLNEQVNHIEITVNDNGNNLNKAQLGRIFEKFYRVPKGNNHDVKGFGIGLYYTKNIIEKHGGMVSASLQNGTTFTLTLPNE